MCRISLSQKMVHSPQPTSFTFHKEIQWHRMVFYDGLIGFLQRPTGDPVCWEPPVRGHDAGFMCRGLPPPIGTAVERQNFDIKPPSGAPCYASLGRIAIS